MTDYSRRAKKGWARRRLTRYLAEIKSYLGFTPESVTVWEDDYELLGGDDPRIELKEGPPKPPCASNTTPIHH